MSEHVDTLPKLHNTPELRHPWPDDRKLEGVRQIVARLQRTQTIKVIDVDGARIVWPEESGGGWALVRASNTQAALVLRFEAKSAARLAELRALVDNALKEESKK